jgi:hypothetical protein
MQSKRLWHERDGTRKREDRTILELADCQQSMSTILVGGREISRSNDRTVGSSVNARQDERNVVPCTFAER